jgi:hypothetical protein
LGEIYEKGEEKSGEMWKKKKNDACGLNTDASLEGYKYLVGGEGEGGDIFSNKNKAFELGTTRYYFL